MISYNITRVQTHPPCTSSGRVRARSTGPPAPWVGLGEVAPKIGFNCAVHSHGGCTGCSNTGQRFISSPAKTGYAQLHTHQGTKRFTLVSFSLFSEQCSLQSALCVHKDLGEAIFYQQRRNIHPQKNFPRHIIIIIIIIIIIMITDHNYYYDHYDNYDNYDQPRFIFVQHAFATSSAILYLIDRLKIPRPMIAVQCQTILKSPQHLSCNVFFAPSCHRSANCKLTRDNLSDDVENGRLANSC